MTQIRHGRYSDLIEADRPQQASRPDLGVNNIHYGGSLLPATFRISDMAALEAERLLAEEKVISIT